MSRTGPNSAPGWVSLLSTIFASGPPKLTNAACVGKAELFDATNGSHDDIERAVSLCRRCSCLRECAAWASQQRHLTGVVAARYHTPNRYDREHDDEHTDADESRRATTEV